MFTVTKKFSNKIANMSFVCACLVVLIHCPKNTQSGVVMFMHNYFPGAFTSIVNAFFFAVAGFFLAVHINEKGWYKSELIKRIHSLLIPYLVLNILWFAVQVVYQWPNVRYPVDADIFHWVDIFRAMGLYGKENPVNGPLWFVRTLLLFVVTLPIFIPIIRPKKIAIVSCIILFCINCFDLWAKYLPETLFWVYRPQWLAFFLGGVVFRLYGLNEVPKKIGLLLLVVGFLLSCYAHPNKLDQEIIPLYGIIKWLNRPILMIGLFSVIPEIKWPKLLTGNSFAVYILHWPLIMMAYIICGHTGTFKLIFGNLFLSIIYMISVIGLTIVAGEICRHFSILNRYILGGR